MQLIVDKVAKAFGINEIFKNVSFMVDKGEHLGLVGVNGSGKTTLLRCLLNPEYVDSGVIKFEPGISVGYVQQGFTDIVGTIWEFMMNSCPEVLNLRIKLQQLEEASADLDGEALEETLEEYARVTKRYEHIDGYNLEARIKRVLIGLGYKEDWWEKDATTLSGGQKTRLMLAAALVRNPDFMILDEPTNHLDIVMTQWLEGYLREFRGGLIVVSHDRA
ncbi:MAG: ABC-F family ATP-binding cassette domain-containing protein, partial [Phascolarctobacterium sp.]|nr:ABC-F family ATP-binding cassette domain-containing protein [Phascolarctobacterium sp.]